MKDEILAILKKFWFVILVGCIFVGMAIYFAWDTNKDKLTAKSVDGKDVIFTLADQNYTADSYYDTLFETKDANNVKNGIQVTFNDLEKLVVDQSIETTDAMKDKADKEAKKLLEQFQGQYGEEKGNTIIKNQLKQLGFDGGIDDLDDFNLFNIKREKLIQKHILKDKKVLKDIKKDKPRVIEHILVKCKDPNNPTKKEKAKMDKIDKELKKGTDFSEVAKKYSDDPGTASKGGSLGVSFKDGSLVKEFEDAAWKLKDGEVTTKWVKTSYGYHLIKCVSSDTDKILKDKSAGQDILSKVMSKNPNYEKQVIWSEAKKRNVKINKSIKKDLEKYVNTDTSNASN